MSEKLPPAPDEKSSLIPDTIDKVMQMRKFEGNLFATAYLMAMRLLLNPPHDFDTIFIPAISTLFATSLVEAKFGRARKKIMDDYDEHPIQEAEVPDMELKVIRLVYRGKSKPLPGSRTLTSGDDVYLISPGGLTPTEPTASLEKKQQLNQHILRSALPAIRDKIETDPYTAVAIELPPDDPLPFFVPSSTYQLSLGELIQNRELAVRNPDTPIVLLSRSQFEMLELSQSVKFQQTLSELNDPWLNTLVEALRHTVSGKEHVRLSSLVMKHLVRLIGQAKEALVDYIPSGIANGKAPRLPVTPIIYVKENSDDVFLIVQNPVRGEVVRYPLNPILGEDMRESAQKPVNPPKPVQRARLAYSLHTLIKTTSWDDLLTEQTLDSQDVLEKVRSLGYKLQPASTLENRQTLRQRLEKGVIHLTKTLIQLIVISALFEQGLWVIKNLTYIQASNYYDRQLLESGEPQIDEPAFPSEVPQSRLVWRISGTMPPDGYYITSTSSRMEEGKFIINTERAGEISFPGTLNPPPDKDYLILSRIMSLGDRYPYDFKIPIYNYATLTDLKLTGPEGSPLPYQAYTLTDGTVSVYLEEEVVRRTPWVVVEALQTQTSASVHAAAPFTPQPNISELSPELQSELTVAAEGGMTPFSSLLNLKNRIEYYHSYSLDPPGKEAVMNADTPEELITTIEHLEGCSCEICNTAMVLEAAMFSPDLPPVNLAIGYIGTSDTLGGVGGGFLRSESAHAFAISDKGNVLDATPHVPATDKMTVEYLRLLESGQFSPERAWELEELGDQEAGKIIMEIRQEDDEKINRAKQGIVAAGARALGLGVAGLGLYQINKWFRQLKPKLSHQAISEFRERRMLNKFSTSDFETATMFLNWLSYAPDGSPLPNTNESIESDLYSQLQWLKRSRQREKLMRYLKNPTEFEQAADNQGRLHSSFPVKKIRQLAKLLIR